MKLVRKVSVALAGVATLAGLGISGIPSAAAGGETVAACELWANKPSWDGKTFSSRGGRRGCVDHVTVTVKLYDQVDKWPDTEYATQSKYGKDVDLPVFFSCEGERGTSRCTPGPGALPKITGIVIM